MTSPAMLHLPTSIGSPLLPPSLLPHLPSLTAPTPTWPLVPTSLPLLLPLLLPTPTPPTTTLAMLDTPTLPTTPAVSTASAALCPALNRRPASNLRPKDRRRTAKDRGRLENENWILEDVV